MNGTNMYMKTSQKRKCDSDTDDGMESTNDLKTVDRQNSEYDDSFSVHNHDDIMMNES